MYIYIQSVDTKSAALDDLVWLSHTRKTDSHWAALIQCLRYPHLYHHHNSMSTPWIHKILSWNLSISHTAQGQPSRRHPVSAQSGFSVYAIFIFIIIIIPCQHHGFTRFYPEICQYLIPLKVNPLDGIQYQRRADECNLLVISKTVYSFVIVHRVP